MEYRFRDYLGSDVVASMRNRYYHWIALEAGGGDHYLQYLDP